MKRISIAIFMVFFGAVFLSCLSYAAEDERSIKRNPVSASSTDSSRPIRTALVIGNSAYNKNPLKNPQRDATAIAEQLRQSGFETVLATDADKKAMERAIKDFGTQLTQGGAGLFYFAGHGMQIGGRNYLLPVDVSIESESDVEYEAIDAGRVLGKMEDAGNGLNIVILDACRDNPFSRGFRSSFGASGLAKMDAPTGSFIAYATKPGSVASDGQSNHSPYTKALLSAIRQPGLNIEQLFKNVRNQVMRDTDNKQVPWEASSLRGDFYFVGAAAGVVATASPAPLAVYVEPARPAPTADSSRSILFVGLLVVVGGIAGCFVYFIRPTLLRGRNKKDLDTALSSRNFKQLRKFFGLAKESALPAETIEMPEALQPVAGLILENAANRIVIAPNGRQGLGRGDWLFAIDDPRISRKPHAWIECIDGVFSLTGQGGKITLATEEEVDTVQLDEGLVFSLGPRSTLQVLANQPGRLLHLRVTDGPVAGLQFFLLCVEIQLSQLTDCPYNFGSLLWQWGVPVVRVDGLAQNPFGKKMPKGDLFLKDGDLLQIGSQEWRVLLRKQEGNA